MRFGPFCERRRPWADGAGGRLLSEVLDRIEPGDRREFGCVWEGRLGEMVGSRR